jgi:alpha-2-macroglobulin
VARNVLISDIGLMAKIGANDEIVVVVTDLKTAQPLPGVELSVLDYQQQLQAMGKSDSEGLAVLRCEPSRS